MTPAGVPAGYGRSCTNCSRAKCRCILRAEGGSCERCHRLGKECHQIAAARKRTAPRSSASRAAQLEEKLEDLVTMLRATQRPGQQPAVALQPSAPSSSSSSSIHATATLLPTAPSRLDSLAAAAAADEPAPGPPGTFGSAGPASVGAAPHASTAHVRPEPTVEEAEMFLVKFRTWLHQFPFMHLPPDLSAQALRRERPFLWTCIMNLTSMSVAQQLVLRDKIRQEVSRKLVQNYEANMDFLLGLIVYLAWANTNSMAGVKPFFILFSQLATTIIYDMGLNRAPSEELQSSLTWRVCPLAHQDPPKSRTMEERRAVLAFWFASSITSSFVGKMDTFGWTTHMDDCLDVLDHNREQPLDEVLVALIRIQRVGEEARKLLRSDVTRDFSQGPTYVFKASLLSRLDNIRHNLSDSLQTHYAVQSQMHCVEAQVHSIAIFSGQMAPVAMRATSMYSCLKATMAWCDNLLAMPVLEVSGMTFAAYVSLSQILGILYRLTISEDPAWDRELLRSSADLPMLLGRLISLFEKVNEAYYAGLEDPDSITPFLKVSWLLRNARNTWEPAFRHYLGSSLIPPSGEAASSSTPTDPGAAAADNSQHVDMGDFAWMADILGPWELH